VRLLGPRIPQNSSLCFSPCPCSRQPAHGRGGGHGGVARIESNHDHNAEGGEAKAIMTIMQKGVKGEGGGGGGGDADGRHATCIDGCETDGRRRGGSVTLTPTILPCWEKCSATCLLSAIRGARESARRWKGQAFGQQSYFDVMQSFHCRGRRRVEGGGWSEEGGGWRVEFGGGRGQRRTFV
jgi:hypothetical protein